MTNNIQLFNINSLTLATLSLFKCVCKAMRGADMYVCVGVYLICLFIWFCFWNCSDIVLFL